MHFKSIEMVGFKSFADKTVINLESGITSVVGPNGCGKSNILDALRWALGEQSAKSLRGNHMQDVIFNGSEERPPTGMAEVTLTFDNADGGLSIDFSEVQITRRVYRSGESEYLINKAPCRLRDIQELFMDTGIGTNAYSMIGQGKISMVLSSKPEDRRFLFEEAAGIIKYKARKRVAMRKLDRAEQNNLRLGDIIAEVQRQMRSLKRQVNAAVRYRELTDELKDLEIRSSWLKYRELSAAIESLRREFATAQDVYEKESGEMSGLEARFEELSLNKLEADRVLHARREGVHDIDSGMEKIEREIALIRQQIEFSKEQGQRAAAEEQELKERAGAIGEQSAETEQRIQALRADKEALDGSVESKQADYEAATARATEVDASLEGIRAESVESMQRRAQNQTASETVSVSIDNLDEQLRAIYERQESDSVRNEQLVNTLGELQRTETEKRGALHELEDKLKALALEEEKLATRAGEANDARQVLRETKSSVDARLTSLRELRDSYEGFAAGVRAIMQAGQQENPSVRGVIGPAGDLVSTQEQYERGIEAALGGNINNVIVESAAAAKSAIGYLKDNKAGRVTFLPLDTIRAGSSGALKSVEGKPGVIGPALDLVRYDSGLRAAVEYLLYNTVLVETIDDALRIAQSGGRYPRLITLDGEVVSSSGAVTGGRLRHESRGLLGRSAEIESLETKQKTIEGDLGSLESQHGELVASLDAVREQSAAATNAHAAQRGEVGELATAIAGHTAELNNLTQATEALNGERDQLCARREGAEEQRRGILEQASAMESEEETLQNRIAEAQENASAARQAQSLLVSGLSDLRVQLAGLNQTIEEAERDLHRQAREAEECLAEAQRRVEVRAAFETNRASLEGDIADHLERSKALSESKEEARKKVIEAESKRQTLLDASEGLEKNLRSLRESVRAAQSAAHKHEMELRHDEDQRAFFEERILSEYKMELSSLSEDGVGQDELSDEDRENRVKEIHKRLDRIGTVNLMAIEEYEALTERNDFLVAQEEDLRKAREALLGVIARIDNTIREMFLETFRSVSQYFRENFRRLFNGGQARIYLLDEDDPLESGIEIEARPPGKKLQTLSLLSGGEQAMTAIALLFSLFKAKPSPFCVLDEVDAPLDDANIGRFLNIVDEYAHDTQFVVITHNKQTMSRAGTLYGITMQERGVSQLVSVKFDEVRQPAEPAA